MATKHNDSCLMKAGDHEPIFVLRAQDKSAPVIVLFWIMVQILINIWLGSDLAKGKLIEAFSLAMSMLSWPKRKLAD